ncbi:MAG: NUDIX domain-containing protein [Prevotellaceae bacterium]|jgi:mutator protein MutT|nr:NUDIX domain-containing protein [Prevotellaceae bacterium]
MFFQSIFKYCPVCGSAEFMANNFKSKKCADCGFVYYVNPSAATAAFILNDKHELLVCRRAKDPAKGTLDLPGGFTDPNETAEEGIRREIEEEIGVAAVEVRYLFSLPNEYEYKGLSVPTMDLFFAAKLLNYSNICAADDVAECFFIPKENINPADFGLQSVRKAMEMFLKE